MPSACAALAAGDWALAAVADSARTRTAIRDSERQRGSIAGGGTTGGWCAMRSEATKRPAGSAGVFVVGQRRAEAQEANGAFGQRAALPPHHHALHERTRV